VRIVDVEETLRRVPLFGHLQPKEIKSLAKWTTTRHFPAGQDIVQEGEIGLGLYCIQSGLVRVTRRGGNENQELRLMGPGESFGELALLGDQPRSATCSTIEPTTVVMLDKSQFRAELRAHAEMALDIIPVLVQWLREAEDRAAAG
jgi:CRP/FNR family transcriptional regulator, cyclic AMP receptor protein